MLSIPLTNCFTHLSEVIVNFPLSLLNCTNDTKKVTKNDKFTMVDQINLNMCEMNCEQ